MERVVESGLEVEVPTGLQVATTRPVKNSTRSRSHPRSFGSQYSGPQPFGGCLLNQSLRPLSTLERATESGLEVEAPTGLQVAPQPDENKYYMGDGGSDNPPFVPPDQSTQSQAKSPGRCRAVWILAVVVVVCLALAVGGGLGVGLHKSSLSRSPQLSLFFSLSAFPSTYLFFYLVTHPRLALGSVTHPLLSHRPITPVAHPRLAIKSVTRLLLSHRPVTPVTHPRLAMESVTRLLLSYRPVA